MEFAIHIEHTTALSCEATTGASLGRESEEQSQGCSD